MAPSEPSSSSAVVDLRTVMPLNSSEAKTLKSTPRDRLAPPVTSRPPVVAWASKSLMRTSEKSGLRPRTVMVRPSPPSRSIDTPGMRWMLSARFRSGKAAMSDDLMTSTIEFSFFLALSALCKDARKPVTTTTVLSAGALPDVASGVGPEAASGAGALVWACTPDANNPANARPDKAPNDTVFKRARSRRTADTRRATTDSDFITYSLLCQRSDLIGCGTA